MQHLMFDLRFWH